MQIKNLNMKIIKLISCFSLFFITINTGCKRQPEPIQEGVDIKTPLKDLNPRIAIGSTIEVIFNDEKYLNTIKTEFSTGESLWYARWGGWLGENSFDYTELNKNINWMLANKMTPTVHMLVGPDTYMPDWLINDQTKTATDLDSMLRKMIYNIMETNGNNEKVAVWNVINELFEDDGTYRANMLWNKMGWEQDSSSLSGAEKINEQHPLFIRKAFTYCREKTNKKLELRDFYIETDNPSNSNYKQAKAMYQLLKHMINTKIPIDAVGIQGHLTVGKCDWIFENNALKNMVAKFKALGIEVYITELDASIENQTWSTSVAEQQKKDYYDYVKQAVEGGAVRISFWGVQDGMDPNWLTDKYPLPWDKNIDKKPAYYGVQKALMELK
jgi:GH35 family endo-1,4-beta-xylanase